MINVVSIITPSYNCERFIAETIASIQAQTYTNWELIIVDDCSTDGSIELIESYIENDSRIKLFKNEKNEGAAVSRNKAIESATGKYIAFLDSDDLWFPEKLEIQIKFMSDNNFAFTYTSYDVIDENNNTINIFSVPSKISYNDLLKTCSIGCLTVIYDLQKLGKMYMPTIKRAQDYGLWLAILKKVDYAHGISESLAAYRLRTESISSNKFKKAKYQWKVYREVEKLSLLRSMYNFIFYIYYGLKKYR